MRIGILVALMVISTVAFADDTKDPRNIYDVFLYG